MKKLIYISLIFILFTSCDELRKPENSTSKTDQKEKVYNGVQKNYLKGKLASTVTYKDSLKNGPATNFYPDGKVNMEFVYKNNQKHGPFKWYYENGKIYQEGNYSKGRKEGIFKTYRKNGTLKSVMPWHNDNPCVGLKEYFESGNEKEVPHIIVNHKNTIKLDNKYVLNIKLSDGSKNVKFYEGKLGEQNSFLDYYPELPGKKGIARIEFYVPPGQLIMQTLTIIGVIKTRDKNYHILTKTVNISIENRT